MGLDVDRFEGEVQEDLLCLLCNKVIEKPSSSTCGHLFCVECLQKSVGKKRNCPHLNCGTPLAVPVSSRRDDIAGKEAEVALAERLGKLSIHCSHQSTGCTVVVPWTNLDRHAESECEYRPTPCENRGCKVQCLRNKLEEHMERCEHRIVECKVCKARLPRKDMTAHQAVRRCFEELNKRRRVASARQFKSELRDHRLEMQHRRHQTEQTERRIEREHYFPPDEHWQRKRAASAGPVLMRAQSVGARVGSAMVVSHYARNLRSAAVLDSCRGCSNRFLSGRRPSARRHSHAKVRTFKPIFHKNHFFFSTPKSITIILQPVSN